MTEEGNHSNQPVRSSFTSVGTSVFERIEEHGRTYHAYKAGSKVVSGLTSIYPTN